MSYPLIQNPSPFAQLAQVLQGIQEQRMGREDRGLRRQLVTTQIAGLESEARARDAATRSRQAQDQAIADLLRGLGSDPETDPQTAAKASRVFRALPIPGVTEDDKKEPFKPSRRPAQPTTEGAAPSRPTAQRGNVGRALSAVLALDDRVPSRVSEFIFDHLASNGAPEGVSPEQMRLLFSGARAGAGVLNFGQVARLVGVPEESLRSAGINLDTKLPRNPPFSLTVGGAQDREQQQLARTLSQLQARVDRANAMRATLLAEERVKLLSPGQRAVTGNRGREALTDPALEARAQAEAMRRLISRVPDYQTWTQQLREGTSRLVNMTSGTVTVTGTQPEADPLDALIDSEIRP